MNSTAAEAGVERGGGESGVSDLRLYSFYTSASHLGVYKIAGVYAGSVCVWMMGIQGV